MKNNLFLMVCIGLLAMPMRAEVLPTVSSSRMAISTCLPTTSTQVISLFPGEDWNGFQFDRSGTYVRTLQNAKGCDSVVLLNVTVMAATLPGKFSVSATEQVYFSQGNLQYCAAPLTGPTTHKVVGDTMAMGIWRFAEQQYDIIGTPNQYTGAAYSGWIDLFNFGCSGYNGVLPYEPTTYYTSNMTNNNYDWGVFNAISNGGDEPGLWFDLDNAQWTYLYSGRINATTKRGWASINGIDGYVFLPDEWSTPEGCTFIPEGYTTVNQYTLAEWAQMESAGAVFLPYEGIRDGYAFTPSDNLQYWTSTYNYRVGKTKNSTSSDYSGTFGAQYGRSVRLVRNAR